MRPTVVIAFSAFAIFLVSACGLIVEITAGRMLAPYVGMSLYTWTAIIAVVLAGFSFGHWVGGWLADKSDPQAFRWLAATMAAGALSTAASLWLIRVFSGPILSTSAGAVAEITLLALALFFIPSLCAGVPSPVLTKIAIDRTQDRAGRTLGTMYAAGAIGAIAGTLLAGFLFISWIGSSGTILTVAVIYALLAALFFSLATQSRAAQGSAAAAVALSVAAAAGMAQLAGPCDRESNYYCIRVVDVSAEVGQDARLMVLDHLAHGMNVQADPAMLLSPYAELMDLLVRTQFDDSREISAYFIGGGAYTLPRAWRAASPGARVTVAEIDPAVTTTAQDLLWADTDAMEVVHGDARAVLQLYPPQSFDVVVGDAFKDIAVPAHLITREFAELVRTRLTADGIYLINLIDHQDRLQALFSMVLTLQQSFPVVEVWVDREQARASGRLTFVILAGQSPMPRDRLIPPGGGQVYLRWPPEDLAARVAEADLAVLTDDFTPIDRLMGPE